MWSDWQEGPAFHDHNVCASPASERAAKWAKLKEDRISIGVCANATGTQKLPLPVIGKGRHPKCFHHFKEIAELPVVYTHSKKAWMNAVLFEKWFACDFKEAVTKKQMREGRVGKVLDNASSHMPMDQGVIAKAKRLYRRSMAMRYLAFPVDFEQFYKTINVKEASLMIHAAWEQVTEQNVSRAFRKLLPTISNNIEVHPDEPSEPTQRAELESLGDVLRQHEDMIALGNDDLWGCFNDTHVAEAVTDDPEEDGEEDDGGLDDPTGDLVSLVLIRSQVQDKPWAADFEAAISRVINSSSRSGSAPAARRSLQLL
ncbi:jerky protein homolog-like [Frankliniella occidentalis]|uniref:Jerky protein homolog-like n=1 Tax=Frankliniella occidentalis TaxID=133901 RepID=A0A9C6XSE2_FRAOC|nr:jerky protein homolog-like [Frankliniella occidentalis]